MFQYNVNTERSICTNCGAGRAAQVTEDGQRETMHKIKDSASASQ